MARERKIYKLFVNVVLSPNEGNKAETLAELREANEQTYRRIDILIDR